MKSETTNTDNINWTQVLMFLAQASDTESLTTSRMKKANNLRVKRPHENLNWKLDIPSRPQDTKRLQVSVKFAPTVSNVLKQMQKINKECENTETVSQHQCKEFEKMQVTWRQELLAVMVEYYGIRTVKHTQGDPRHTVKYTQAQEQSAHLASLASKVINKMSGHVQTVVREYEQGRYDKGYEQILTLLNQPVQGTRNPCITYGQAIEIMNTSINQPLFQELTPMDMHHRHHKTIGNPIQATLSHTIILAQGILSWTRAQANKLIQVSTVDFQDQRSQSLAGLFMRCGLTKMLTRKANYLSAPLNPKYRGSVKAFLDRLLDKNERPERAIIDSTWIPNRPLIST